MVSPVFPQDSQVGVVSQVEAPSDQRIVNIAATLQQPQQNSIQPIDNTVTAENSANYSIKVIAPIILVGCMLLGFFVAAPFIFRAAVK